MMVFFDRARGRLADAARRLRPSPLLLAAGAMVVLLGIAAGEVVIPLALAVVFLGLVLFAGIEFLTLMRLPDDAFPGRFDKLVWALALLFLPPIGAPLFWYFRRTTWDDATAKPHPRPWLHDWS